MLRLWNSRDCETVGKWAHTEDGDCETVSPMKQSRYSWLSGGYKVVIYFQWGKTWNFDILSHIWPWRSRSVAPPPPPPPPPPTIGILTKVFCTSGPNLVILAWMGGDLWCGQAQNGINLDYRVKFALEGQIRSVHKIIGTLTKVFCIFGPNLIILAWTGPELSRGQASNWHTDRQTLTDAGNDNTRWPKLASVKKLKYIHII